MDEWVEQFARAFTDPGPLAPYQWLAGDAANGEMPSYELTVGRRRAFNARIDALLRLGAAWSAPPEDIFTYNAPSPAPALGLIPADRFDAPREVPDRSDAGTSA